MKAILLTVFYSVVLFSALCVIEVIKCSNEISGNSADTLELDISFFSATRRACITDNSCISANRVVVYRMVDRAVPDTVIVHQAY